MSSAQVQVNVGVNAAGVQQGMEQVGQAAQRAGQQAAQGSQRAATATDTWQRSLGRLRSQARLFGADIIGRFTAAYGAMALFDKAMGAMNQTMQHSQDISKASKKAGLGVEEYQKISRVASETGASVDEAAAAAGRYATMIREAAAGNAEAIESLRNLGFTDEQVRKGNISTIDVLARLSAQYKNAANEAERLRIAKESGTPREILEAGPAAVAISGAGGIKQRARVERESLFKENEAQNGGFWKSVGSLFSEMGSGSTAALGRISGRSYGFLTQEAAKESFQAAPAAAGGFSDVYGIREIQAAMQREGISDEEKGSLENKLKEAFAKFADDFRLTFTGKEAGGVTQTREMVDAELQRKFVEMFPQYGAPAVGAGGAGPASGGANAMASGVSSMQAIGGGGGFYAGASDMVSLATRTADATEAVAKNTEALLGKLGGSNSSPQPVHISSD